MKKILLLLPAMAVMPLGNAILAQCDVSNLVVSNVRPASATVDGATGVNYTMDLKFTVEENNGNKYTWIHLFLEKDYNYQAWHLDKNAPYPCPQTNNASINPPVKSGTSSVAILGWAMLNFGFDIELVSTGAASSTGILTTYPYDATVVLNYVGATIRKVPWGDGKTYDVYVNNVTFFKANCVCTDYLAVRAFNWATNSNASTGGKVQCYSCANKPFVIGDPTVSGNVNCVNPRTFNLFIDSRFDNSATPGADPLNGSYRLYCDVNQNGQIDAADILVKNATSFTTSTASVSEGFQTRFIQLNGSLDYVFPPGDENSAKNLIAVVSIDNPEYIGADVSGILTNSCAPLPVTLKSFDAQQYASGVRLMWTTAMEYNFKGFEIERKLGNGGGFVKIGFMAAKGDELKGADYSFMDQNLPGATIAFYRLRLVDMDGSAIFSDIKAVRNNAQKMYVTVSPNPSNGNVNIAVPADAGIYDVMLHDYSGKLLQRMVGANTQLLQLRDLMPGMYMLMIQFRKTGEQLVERIIVQ